jgi:SAM-dependent methyltransferase
MDTARWLWSHVTSRYREWQLGISTSELIDSDRLGLGFDCNGYEPISYACFETAMAGINIRPAADVFLDYGCGMGRAVVLAATHPFRKVIGVELSADLCRIARQQVERARLKLCCDDVEIVDCDAAKYELPPEVTVVFLWNSFTGSVLESVLERIRESLERSPRPLTLLYALPHAERDAIRDCPWLTDRRELDCRFWTGVRLVVYRGEVISKPPQIAEAPLTVA